MIELLDITKNFILEENTVQVLKGISLCISKSEFISIMGPSGSGKTTLSAILGCLSKPTTGQYTIDHNEVSRLSAEQLARFRNQKIGFIFQDFNLLDGLTAVENVALPLFYAGRSASECQKQAIARLRDVGLGERLKHLPKQLSGGQKQRVAIARALINEPAFLFADEPTGALDKKTGREVLGLLQKLNFEGHTIVMVTHSHTDANYSKRIVQLVDGTIVKDELVEKSLIGLEDTNSTILPPESQIWRLLQRVESLKAEDLPLLERLLSKTTDEFSLMEALKAMSHWSTKQVMGILEELFNHPFWGVRVEVLRCLNTKAKEEAIRFIFKGLKDQHPAVRSQAALLLKCHWPFSISNEENYILMRLLKDSDERVRATIVMILGIMTNDQFIPHLMEATEDEDGRVRANAIESLGEFFKKKMQKDSITFCAKRLILDHNPRTRANAALLLSEVQPSSAFECLKEMIQSDNVLMRSSAAWALGKIIVPEAHTLLLDSLTKEKEENVSNQIIRALTQHSKEELSLSSLEKLIA